MPFFSIKNLVFVFVFFAYQHAIGQNNLAKQHFDLGMSKYYSKDYQAAISAYTQAITAKKSFPTAYCYRGLSYAALKEYDKAYEDFSEAIKIKPLYVQAYIERGLISLQKNEYDKAIADYDKAASLDPSDAEPILLRGKVKYLQKNYNGALLDLSKAIGLAPDDAEEAYFQRGLTHYALKEYKAALADLSHFIEEEDEENTATAYLQRAKAKLALADTIGACDDAQKAQKLGLEESSIFIREHCQKVEK